jgi:hypothetical protein
LGVLLNADDPTFDQACAATQAAGVGNLGIFPTARHESKV